MRFFIPGAEDRAAEQVLAEIHTRVQQHTALATQKWRIYSIEFVDPLIGRVTATVGKTLPRYNELVVAIVDAAIAYYVVTRTNGLESGMPIRVFSTDVLHVRGFE